MANGSRARASFAEGAICVGISTLAGGLLGASTLPFYPVPKDHTENVFYGAAFGAVAGVVIASYAGFPADGDVEELNDDASARPLLRKQDPTTPSLSTALLPKTTSVVGVPLALSNFTVTRW